MDVLRNKYFIRICICKRTDKGETDELAIEEMQMANR